MPEKIPLTWTDAWLLHAILLAARKGDAPLEDVLGAAESIQQACPTFDELDGGIARLFGAGLIEIVGKRFRVSAEGNALRVRIANVAPRRVTAAIEKELGIPPAEPPYAPIPADPLWTSGAFTVDEVRAADRAYRRKFWENLKKQGAAEADH